MWTNLTPVAAALLIILGAPVQIIGGPAGTAALDVSVLYRERLTLPPGSSVTVTLSDVSRMDVKAVEISSTSQQITTGPPYLLTLTYDPDKITDNHRYSLKARIENSGKLLFISTHAIDPFRTAPRPIEIVTQKVASLSAEPAAASLLNTRWLLSVARGTEITVKEGAERPFILMLEAQNQVQGFGGCNIFRGSFSRQGSSLEFPQVAATMKMCVENMEQEQLFFSILGATTSYEISGEELHLFDAEKELIGTFRAVNLN